MRFSFTAEQEEFRATLRRALETRSPTKEVRRLMATEAGFERDAWKKFNQEMGLTAVAIPEAYGGLELTMEEEVMVLLALCQTSPCFRSLLPFRQALPKNTVWLPRKSGSKLRSQKQA